jgi:hypothetical protein
MTQSEAFVQECDQLFDGLNIFNPQVNQDAEEAKRHRGKYPTIFVSFVSPENRSGGLDPSDEWSRVKAIITFKISKVFQDYSYCLNYLKTQLQEKENLRYNYLFQERERERQESEQKRQELERQQREEQIQEYEKQIQNYLRITGLKEMSPEIAQQLYSQIVLAPLQQSSDRSTLNVYYPEEDRETPGKNSGQEDLSNDISERKNRPTPFDTDIHTLTRDAEIFQRLLDGQPKDDLELSNSLFFLIKIMYQIYGQPVVVLIDEYDHLWNQLYENEGVLAKLTCLFSGLFSSFAKPAGVVSTRMIQKIVFTGILRISKASIFSGLNNLIECTIFERNLSEFYGFTQSELENLLTRTNQLKHKKSVMEWYNGYTMGRQTIYNPWSIMHFLANRELKPYWVDTANHQFLKNLILSNKGTSTNLLLKELIESAPQETIEVQAKEHISIDDLRDPKQIWSFLLQTGYLTLVSWEFLPERGCFLCQVRIPNVEVRSLFLSMIQAWLEETPQMNELVEAAFLKKYAVFFKILQILLKSKYHTALFAREEDSLEEVYHCFLLFVLNQNTTQPRYELLPEESTGLGRADIILIDHKLKQVLVIEIKRTQLSQELKITAEEAIQQAKEKKYGSHLPSRYRKYRVLPAIGIAFCAKQIAMKVHGLKKTWVTD